MKEPSDLCKDFKWLFDVSKKTEVPCSACKGWTLEQRSDIRRSNYAKHATPPTLSVESLTSHQKASLTRFKAIAPWAPTITLLTWIEGSEYTPETDADIIELAHIRTSRIFSTLPDVGCSTENEYTDIVQKIDKSLDQKVIRRERLQQQFLDSTKGSNP